MNRLITCLIILLLSTAASPVARAVEQPAGPQTIIAPAPPQHTSPQVIIYTLSTCPHCKAAKEYFTKNNIQFVNREVDTDSQNMGELMQIYEKMDVPEQKRGVPLILIGDSIKLQGFKEEKVQEALKKVLQK